MAEPLLISNGTLIDGTGAPPRATTDVLTDGDRIVAVGPDAQAEAGRHNGTVNPTHAPGLTVMPGLIDAHTHLSFGEPTGNDELFFHRTEGYSSMLSVYNAR